MLVGAALTLVVLYTLPVAGLMLYGGAFRSAYADCALAKVHARTLNHLTLEPHLFERVKKTEDIEQLRCLDSGRLYRVLREMHVSEAKLGAIESDVAAALPELLR